MILASKHYERLSHPLTSTPLYICESNMFKISSKIVSSYALNCPLTGAKETQKDKGKLT